MFEYVILFVVSLVANAFSAFAGGGAGLLQLPALIFLGLPFSVALATHKLASVALGIGASLRHFREGGLERRFVLLLLSTGIPGVVLGASVILQVPDRPAQLALGILTISLGIYSWFNKSLGTGYAPVNRDLRGSLIGGGILFCIGILNGSLTSGTGLFVTLWLVRWFGLDYKRAVAHTLILVGLFWNSSGALALGLQGAIRWDWVPVLLVASALGGYLGAHLSIVKSNQMVKRVFEWVTILVGLKLIIG